MCRICSGWRGGHHVAAAESAGHARTPLYFRLRRLLDIAVSAAVLMLLLPLIAVVAVLVLLDVGPPVLFRQTRPGQYMRPFTLYKLRTMRAADGPGGTMAPDDKRTSALGRFLRRTRFDEVPQLYNVLVGDMSFIGPRPLLPRDLPEGPAAAERAALRPGITGWAQVNGGHQLNAAEKMALDRWYARHASLAVDARILGLNVSTVSAWRAPATSSSARPASGSSPEARANDKAAGGDAVEGDTGQDAPEMARVAEHRDAIDAAPMGIADVIDDSDDAPSPASTGRCGRVCRLGPGCGKAPPQPPGTSPIRLYLRFRRVAEVALSAGALLALLPVMAAVAALVLLDGGRPILFRQVRTGRHLRPFTLDRFRTIRIAFAADGTTLIGDGRAGAIGRLLRRTRLDELPQLYNVLLGDMAFIGPRPLLPRDLPVEVTEHAAVRPGITGWAQANGGHRLTIADKTALDVWYVRHAGPPIDARVVGLTVRTMFFGGRINHAEILRATPPPAPSPAPDPRPRLLIVNRCFHPDEAATAQLLTDLVGALDRERLVVTVFTGRQRYDDPHTLLPAHGRYCGAEVRRLWTTRFGRARLPGRAIDDATFYAGAFAALLAHARRGDVLLAKTDPPLISVVAWAVARLTGARLVNWCQDLFPEIAAALGVRPARGPAGALLRALRNRSLKDAVLNVALCERMAERLAGEGVPARSVAVIHNWVDGDAIRPLAPEANPLRRAWGLDGAFVLGYSGNLGRVHDVDSVVELIEALGAEPDLVCLFIGAGWGHRRLKDAVAARRLPNILFRAYEPRERLAQSLTVPDLHLITLSPACEGLIMPSKLYGALAAGRPVAFIGDPAGGVARILRAHDAGLVAAPGCVPALAARIRELRREPARLQRLGANARRAYDGALNRDASLSAWVRHLEAVAATGAPAPRLVPAA